MQRETMETYSMQAANFNFLSLLVIFDNLKLNKYEIN